MEIHLEEEWKDIPSYEGLYQASSLGNIRSLKRIGTDGRVLRPALRKDGYLQVSLSKDKKQHSFLVHRLVALSFLSKEEGKDFVNHINGNKKDNVVENLEFCTVKENIIHKHYVLNKNIKPVICVETGVEYPSVREAERQTGIGNTEISKCCRGLYRYKTAGGFHWKFKESGDEID